MVCMVGKMNGGEGLWQFSRGVCEGSGEPHNHRLVISCVLRRCTRLAYWSLLLALTRPRLD
jgi:hypothetical protein